MTIVPYVQTESDGRQKTATEFDLWLFPGSGHGCVLPIVVAAAYDEDKDEDGWTEA